MVTVVTMSNTKSSTIRIPSSAKENLKRIAKKRRWTLSTAIDEAVSTLFAREFTNAKSQPTAATS